VAKCPACGSNAMNMKGFGTERIAEELAIYFPEARISRFDQDSIRKRKDFQNILNSFENGSIDILVGTQLLSKGLDFKNVGLVVIVDADMLINIPDFRSHERAFQQMHQVAGRAGRGHKQGTVLIQTAQPNHPVIQAIQNNRYKELIGLELPMRIEHHYPPYYRLIKVNIKHRDYQMAKDAAFYYSAAIKKALNDRVLGPQQPPVGKIRNYYIQQILIKINPKTDSIIKIKKFILNAAANISTNKDLKGVIFDFDVDPN
jgi:primosomal protein N' (replication factor Y)